MDTDSFSQFKDRRRKGLLYRNRSVLETVAARVFGPLWDVPNSRSSISFEAGANYTQDDIDAAAATPTCAFDTEGTMLRFTRDISRKVMVRDAFVASASAGSWRRLGDKKSVAGRLPPMSEDRVLTGSGRFILLYQRGQAMCFDLFTGETKDDAWLTQSFAHARSIQDLNNVRLFLTEDVNHLVVSPMEIWNNGQGKIFEKFDLDGKTYKRAEVGLAYSRPALKPFLFPRKMDKQAGFLAESPHGAISIAGELYLFMNDKTRLRLYTPDGSKEIVAKATTWAAWPTSPYPKFQHAAVADELVMFDSNEITANEGPGETVSVVRWNYKTNSVTRDKVRIIDLFERRGSQLRPKVAIAIK